MNQLNITVNIYKTMQKSQSSSMNGFGGTVRINHNSSKFYKRKIFKDVQTNTIEQEKDLGKYTNRALLKYWV